MNGWEDRMFDDYILQFKDDNYPALLKEIANPPRLLYVRTKLKISDLFKNPCIAVVGTRHISSYGEVVTKKITSQLSKLGFTIVSGLARGVDLCAHQTALSENGITIAVLGSGFNKIYPPENLEIAKMISENGALISEFPSETKAVPANFPRRNRIISGLSLGVVVTEASEKSGSMITVSHAAEQGREVFAVPGPITSEYSKGTSELLKKGAKLVTSVSDILEELPK